MNKQLIHSLQTNYYKNIFDTRAVLKTLNLIIGPNCSGKTNFISIFKFLKDSVVSNNENELRNFETAINQLGDANILDKGIQPPSNVQFIYNFLPTENLPNGLSLDIELFVGAKNSKVTIAKECLSGLSNTTDFCYYKFHDKEVSKGSVTFHSNNKLSYEIINNIPNNSLGLSLIHQLLENSKQPPEKVPIYKISRKLVKQISGWQFYNSNEMNLNEIKLSEPKIGSSDTTLSRNGNNLALVIDNLFQQDILFEETLNKAIRSILPITKRIRPIRAGLMSMNVQWCLDGFDDCFFLNEMSDGAIRMLCWAVIFLQPNLPSLIVVDEPEAGLHISWMPVLAEWIKSASQKTQVIICTHSPDFLDHFTDQPDKVLCFSSVDKAHFTLKPLSEKKLKDALEEGWQLGDLYRVGDPAIGGWPW
jgi:predicted ATPase